MASRASPEPLQPAKRARRAGPPNDEDGLTLNPRSLFRLAAVARALLDDVEMRVDARGLHVGSMDSTHSAAVTGFLPSLSGALGEGHFALASKPLYLVAKDFQDAASVRVRRVGDRVSFSTRHVTGAGAGNALEFSLPTLTIEGGGDEAGAFEASAKTASFDAEQIRRVARGAKEHGIDVLRIRAGGGYFQFLLEGGDVEGSFLFRAVPKGAGQQQQAGGEPIENFELSGGGEPVMEAAAAMMEGQIECPKAWVWEGRFGAAFVSQFISRVPAGTAVLLGYGPGQPLRVRSPLSEPQSHVSLLLAPREEEDEEQEEAGRGPVA